MTPMDEAQYRAIAMVCDRILRDASATPSWVAVPWLHVTAPHPSITRRYEGLVSGWREHRTPPTRLGGELMHAARSLRLVARALGGGGVSIDRIAQEVAALGRRDVVLISWLIDETHAERDEDFAFGDLQQRLAARGRRSLLLLRNQTNVPTHRLRLRARRDGDSARVLLPDRSNPLEELAYAWASAAVRSGLRALAERSADAFVRLAAREAAAHAFPAVVAENLRLAAQLRAIFPLVQPKLLLTLYEGNAWEKCAAHAAAEASPATLRGAYQQTAMWRLSHAVRRRVREDGAFDPQLVLTPGTVTRDWLASEPGLAATKILALGALRRGTARAEQPSVADAVLALPDGIESENVILFDAAIAAAYADPAQRFILRSHPLAPYTRISRRLRLPPPPNVELSRAATLDADLARSRVVLYRGSSTVLYAVLAGLKPAYLVRENELDLDLLGETRAWRERVASTKDLLTVVRRDVERDHGERLAEWRVAVDYCERFFAPVDPAVLDETLALADVAG